MTDRYNLDVYWVALYKDEPLYFVAGPFCDYEQAEKHLETMPQVRGRCRHVVVKSQVPVEMCGA